MSTALKVIFVNDSIAIKPCGYHTPPCKKAGPIVELTYFVVQHLLLNSSNLSRNLEIVPMESHPQVYTFNGSHSTLGSLLLGETDISPPWYFLTEQRASLLPYAYPLYRSSIIFVYKKTDSGIQPNLGLFTSSQWYVWVFATLIGLLGMLIKVVGSLLFPKGWLFEKYMARQKFVLAFFFGLFLRYIATQLVVMFTEIEMSKAPFTNGEELAEKLEKREYTALVWYAVARDEYVNPVRYKGKTKFYDRMIAAHKHNPSIVIPNLDGAMEKLLNSDENMVLVTSSDDLYYLRATYCGFNFQVDFSSPVIDYTMYTRPRLHFELVPAAPQVLQREYDRILANYHPTLNCNRQEMEKAVGPQALNFNQIQSAFWLLATAEAVGFGIMIIEWLKNRVIK